MGSIFKLLIGLVMRTNPIGAAVTAAESVIPMLKIAIIAIDLATLAVLGFGVYHYHSVAQQNEVKYAVAINQNSALVQTIAEDGKRVIAYKADSDSRAEVAKEAVANSLLEAKKYKDKADLLLSAKPASSSDCESANTLFNSYLEGGTK